MSGLGSRTTAPRPACDYCGDLGWTVERYGRVTHKESCPHRVNPWTQTDPQIAEMIKDLEARCVRAEEALQQEQEIAAELRYEVAELKQRLADADHQCVRAEEALRYAIGWGETEEAARGHKLVWCEEAREVLAGVDKPA